MKKVLSIPKLTVIVAIFMTFKFSQNQDGDFSNKGSFKRYVTPERGGRVANFVTNRYGN